MKIYEVNMQQGEFEDYTDNTELVTTSTLEALAKVYDITKRYHKLPVTDMKVSVAIWENGKITSEYIMETVSGYVERNSGENTWLRDALKEIHNRVSSEKR